MSEKGLAVKGLLNLKCESLQENRPRPLSRALAAHHHGLGAVASNGHAGMLFAPDQAALHPPLAASKKSHPAVFSIVYPAER